jgi:predicted AlkP superfamily phosphohydrolase/phosphomutase
MKKPKLMVIGLDSIGLSLLDHFAKHCPTLTGLMAKGASGHAIPSFPIYTPTNWAALSTGADSSTTGAEGWFNEDSGRRLSTFDRRAIACETIFESAAREDLKTLALAYPSSHPTREDTNMVLGPLDRGLVSNCLVPGRIEQLKYRKKAASFTLLQAPKAASGAAIAKSVGATEDGADVRGKARSAAADTIKAWVFPSGKTSWKLGFSAEAKKAEVKLTPQKWSDPIPVSVHVPDRPGQCVLRVMIFDEGKRVAVSEAYDIGALGKPAELAQEVYDELGPPTEHSVFYTEMCRLFAAGREDSTITELARRDLEAQGDWIVSAARLVQRKNPWDVFYLHYHYPDNVLHRYLPAAEGRRGYSRKQQILAVAAIGMCLEICDRLVARLLKLAGSDTTVLCVSDHGNVPNRYGCDIHRRLIETGIVVLTKKGHVSRQKSLAWVSDRVSTWIDVNAKPGTRRYLDIQNKVIDALLDWRTDKGERVVALALKRKDSHLLGYYGRNCADVTFHYNSGFAWGGTAEGESVTENRAGANHGPQMPVTFSKISDNMAFFILKGPGVHKGLRRDFEAEGPVRVVDLLPTICHLSGVPCPKDATGAVRRDLLK